MPFLETTPQGGVKQKALFGVWIYREIPLIPLAAAGWTPSTEFLFLHVRTKAGKCMLDFISENNKKVWKTEVSEGSLLAVTDSTRFFILKLDCPLGLGFFSREESGAFVLEYMKKMYEARNYKGRRKVSWWRRPSAQQSAPQKPPSKPFIVSVPLPAPTVDKKASAPHRIEGSPAAPSFIQRPRTAGEVSTASSAAADVPVPQAAQKVSAKPPEDPEAKRKREEQQRLDAEAQAAAIARTRSRISERREMKNNLNRLEIVRDRDYQQSAIVEARRRIIEKARRQEMEKLHPPQRVPPHPEDEDEYSSSTSSSFGGGGGEDGAASAVSAGDKDDQDEAEKAARRRSGMVCVLCHTAPADRVIAPCGHASFCGNCIAGYMDSGNNVCPQCGACIGGIFHLNHA